MKSEVKEKEKQELKFPCLMNGSSGNIYLITGRNNNYFIGTRIYSQTDSLIGEFKDEFVGLTLFNGTVTLSND